jgi:hypothetical protein
VLVERPDGGAADQRALSRTPGQQDGVSVVVTAVDTQVPR